MKKLHKRNIVKFTAPNKTQLSIFNYPEIVELEKGDQLIFKIRFKKPSKIISHTRAN